MTARTKNEIFRYSGKTRFISCDNNAIPKDISAILIMCVASLPGPHPRFGVLAVVHVEQVVISNAEAMAENYYSSKGFITLKPASCLKSLVFRVSNVSP